MNRYCSPWLLFHSLFPDVPSAPDAPQVTEVFGDHCVLTWKAPSSDGGCPLSGYTIERSQKNANRWLPINREPISDTTAKVTDLSEGTDYEFRIVAANKAGTSKASAPSRAFTAKDPWGE